MTLLIRIYFNAVCGGLGGLLGWMLFGIFFDKTKTGVDQWLLGVARPEYEVAPKEEVPLKRESTEEKPAKPPR